MRASYLAGLFDGEGCVVINHLKNTSPSRFVLHVQITNIHLPVLLELKRIFGGQVANYQYKTRINIYTWVVRAQMAIRFLEKVYPYSVIKKEQIRLGIDFQKDLHNRKLVRNEAFKSRRKLQELKKVRYTYGTS